MTSSVETHKGWKIAVAALVLTCVSQSAAQIYWFGGWKSDTDESIKVLEEWVDTTKRINEEIPATLQTLKHQQLLTIQGLNSLLKAQGKNPIIVLPQVAGHQ